MSEADLEEMWAARAEPGPAEGASPGALDRARLRWEQAVVRHATTLYGRPGALLHDEFGADWARHRECAAHHDGEAVRALRLAYGVAHMALIQAPLDYAKWATRCPLSLFLHALAGFAVWACLLLGGYL